MAEPIIVIKENGLVIDVDFGNEKCNPPQYSPSTGPSRTYEIRWSDADFKQGDWEVSERPGPGGKKEAVLRWKRKPKPPKEEPC